MRVLTTHCLDTMLSFLKIKNLALVEDVTWELAPGLVGVTGETGAGKSIIVGAVKLILGERADRSLIRTGQEQCSVEASFHVADTREIESCTPSMMREMMNLR